MKWKEWPLYSLSCVPSSNTLWLQFNSIWKKFPTFAIYTVTSKLQRIFKELLELYLEPFIMSQPLVGTVPIGMIMTFNSSYLLSIGKIRIQYPKSATILCRNRNQRRSLVLCFICNLLLKFGSGEKTSEEKKFKAKQIGPFFLNNNQKGIPIIFVIHKTSSSNFKTC